jgi:hypothetical protein
MPTGFLYNKSVVITHNDAPVDYPVKFLVGETSGATGEQFDLGGHCSSFPNDIRFYDEATGLELTHWLEGCSGVSPNRLATFWVKIPDLTTADQTMIVYYGKDGLASGSSDTGVFTVFETFGGAWTKNVPVVVSTGALDVVWTVDGAGYHNRTAISVTERTGNTLTDYPVKIPVDSLYLYNKNYMTATGNEVRFTTSDGSTLLSFWREKNTGTTFPDDNTFYWVKGTWTGGATTTIYMYFDPTLTSQPTASSMVAVFPSDVNGDTCDDFIRADSSTTVGKMTGQTNNWTLAAGFKASIDTNRLKIVGTDALYYGLKRAHGKSADPTNCDGWMAEFRIQPVSAYPDVYQYFYAWLFGSVTHHAAVWNPHDGDIYVGFVDTNYNLAVLQWFRIGLEYDISADKASYWRDQAETSYAVAITTGSQGEYDFMFGTSEIAPSNTYYVDRMFIRPYVRLEPIVTPLTSAVLRAPPPYTALDEPTVIYESGTYKLWCRGTYKNPAGTQYSHVLYATSTDMKHWTWNAGDATYTSHPVIHEEDGRNGPFVMKLGDTYYCYVTSTWTAIDRFYSADGLSWTKDKDNCIVPGTHPDWDDGANLGNNCVWIDYRVSDSLLAEALDDSETGVDVDDGTDFDQYGYIKIGDEIMTISSIASNTLTVVRGVNGTDPVAHDDNSPITVLDWKMLWEANTGTLYQTGFAGSYDGKTWVKYPAGVYGSGNPVGRSVAGTVSHADLFYKDGSTYYFSYHWSPTGVLPTDMGRLSSTNISTCYLHGGAFVGACSLVNYGGDQWPTLTRSKTYEGYNITSSLQGQIADGSIISQGGMTYQLFAQIPWQGATTAPWAETLGLAYTTDTLAELVAGPENGLDPAKWNRTTTGGYITTGDGSETVCNLIVNNNTINLVGATTVGPYSYAVRFRMKSDVHAGATRYTSAGFGDPTITDRAVWIPNNAADPEVGYCYLDDVSPHGTATADQAIDPTSYHVYEVRWLASDDCDFYFDDVYADDVNVDVPVDALAMAIRENYGTAAYRFSTFDFIIVRKCRANEPVFASAGDEVALADPIFWASNI